MTSIDLPMATLRVLHSEYVSWLVSLADEEIQHAFARRTRGLTFLAFVDALVNDRYCVSTRVVDDVLHVGIALPISDSRFDRLLFEVSGAQTAVTVDYLLAAGMLELDAEIEDLLGGHE